MNILCIGSGFGPLLTSAGHTVRTPDVGHGILDLPNWLATHDFTPDLIFQEEWLGPRLLVCGLEAIPCPKVFWAIDSHLNMYWHRHYGRLFDLVLTPHVTLHTRQPEGWRLPAIGRFARPGYQRTWIPHAQRNHDISFVGVLNNHRMLRAWLAELLTNRYGVVAQQNVPFADMLHLYDDTRLLPNEAICNEVNYRLMEGASCGACVLTPDAGDDLASLFEPGREILVYRDGLELRDMLDFLQRRPAVAEAIGRSARQRVLATHLPEHAIPILLQATSMGRTAATGDDACRAFALSLVQRTRAGALDLTPEAMHNLLRPLAPHPDVECALVRLFSEYNDDTALHGRLQSLLVSGFGAGSLDLNVACAGAALKAGDLHLAKKFWYRHHQAANLAAPERPQSIYHACLLWADMLRKSGREGLPGFPFKAAHHCPENAWEMLLLAALHAGDDKEYQSRLTTLTHNRNDLVYFHLCYSAAESLHNTHDWRSQTAHGLACLKAYRIEAGLAELAQAAATANACSKGTMFLRMLTAQGGAHVVAGLAAHTSMTTTRT